MKKVCLLFAVLAIVLCFVGCKQVPVEDPVVPVPATEPEPDAAQVYADALQPYVNAKIEVKHTRNVQLADQSFSEESEYILQYKNLDTDDFTATVDGQTDFGYAEPVSVSERYRDGMVYGFLDEFGYNGESDQAGFFARYVPAVVLDASLYDIIVFEDEDTIAFSGASSMEQWLYQDGYTLVDASGTADLNADGSLSGYTYTVTYSYGAALISLGYETSLSQEDITVLPPDKSAAKVAVYDANVPTMFVRAFNYLMQSEGFSVVMEESISSEALDLYYYGTTYTDFHYVDDLLFYTDSVIQISDMRGRNASVYSNTGLYRDRKFLVSENGGEPIESEMFRSNIVDLADLLRSANYPSLDSIDEMYVSVVPGGYVIDFTFNKTFETLLRTGCAETLTGDMNALERQSSKYTPQLAEGYVSIDLYSGLPTAVAVGYGGLHTIDGVEQELAMSVGQTINAASLEAYTNITGEPMPIPEDLEQPTPAFYRVTGPEGQEMWLLGTIHVGDARTTNLPAEIYEAFDAADALAVEFDDSSFEEQVWTDSALAEKIYKSYYYEDGSTIDTHLDLPDLYEWAMQTLKLTGHVNTTMLNAKPIVWSWEIEDYCLRQGYQFFAEYGVDNQLLQRAREQDKQILDVESGEFQLQLLTGYSDEVQQMILASSLSTDPLLYNAQLAEMFELWCEGDEAALRENLKTDTSQMTPEELELYQEYTKAMDTDRNIQMLEVAKGYLESGETIFYAVGLAHLLAEDGLVNTLRQAGYTVEQVVFS